jgi:Protein of unknown function (DUF2442)
MSFKTIEIYDPLTAKVRARITQVEVVRTPVLRVSFSDGAVREVDFSDAIASSKWFFMLAVPTTFDTVEIINNGRGLQWITGADYCADALRLLADQQLVAQQKDH